MCFPFPAAGFAHGAQRLRVPKEYDKNITAAEGWNTEGSS